MLARTKVGHSQTRRRVWLGIVGAVSLAAVFVLVMVSPALAFPDVPAGHPYEDAVNTLSDGGIISGYTTGYFGLVDPVKRAQFAKMIVGTLDIPPGTSTATRFTDLGSPDTNGYPHIFVQAAYNNGITYGTNPTQTLFAPWNYIHRDQVVSMIVRGANSLYPSALEDPPSGTSSVFDGVPEPHGSNLRVAEYNGLLDGLIGMGPNWNVTATATRGEVAQVLYNLLSLLLPPGNEVWVYADGSGDYPTLEAALAEVETGTTIHLGPGSFPVSHTLPIDYSVNLVGSAMQGPNSTIIACMDTVLDIGPVSFSAQDIRFVCLAYNKPTNAVVATDSTLDLLRCSFSGAVRWNGTGGSGLSLYGAADAVISDCVFTLNDLDGLAVDDDTHVVVQDCEAFGNDQNGITFWGDSSGTVTGTTCDTNGLHGISTNEGAEVTLRDNECSENGDSGIYFGDYATGTISNNACDANGVRGIDVNDNADATIEDNECSGNQDSGIVLSENATGTIRRNLCSDSVEYDGIFIHDNAAALVESNTCLYNGESGINFSEYATGIVRNNECAGNWAGIYVERTANPTLSGNYLHDNTYRNLYDERMI
jgi:parallel beta-helix repeat protein